MRGDLLSLVLVAPLVFRAPPVVSGRAARCARGRRPTREPSVPRAFGPPNWWCCLWPYGCCGRRMARPPARLGGLTSLGAAPRSPPVPSGPSGALHTGGACGADVWLGASARCPARSRRPRAPQPSSLVLPAPSTPVGPGVLACGSARCLGIRPGPATAHGHRSQEPPTCAASGCRRRVGPVV